MSKVEAIPNEFFTRTEKMPLLFSQLKDAPLYCMKPRNSWKKLHAIYTFYEGEVCRHVGRTRNLQQRVRGHLANSHYSASFAFGQTKKILGIKASYRKGEGRADLFKQANFSEEFKRQRDRLEGMKLQFLEVTDPIDQYLLELYAAMELETSLLEFETS